MKSAPDGFRHDGGVEGHAPNLTHRTGGFSVVSGCSLHFLRRLAGRKNEVGSVALTIV
jgi:hypothetical protein